jgi:hypothetical protein
VLGSFTVWARRLLLLLTLLGISASSFLVFLQSPGAAAPTVESGGSPLQLDGSLWPGKLPRREFIPVALTATAKLERSETPTDTFLTKMVIDIDRNVRTGQLALPSCTRDQLERKGGRRRCHSAIVGEGSLTLAMGGGAREKSPLSIVNGGGSPGLAKLFLIASSGSFSTLPITEVRVARRVSLPFGSRATVSVPEVGDEPLGVVGVQLRFPRLIDHSLRVGFFSARCPSGHLLASVPRYFLSDGSSYPGGGVPRTCTPRS